MNDETKLPEEAPLDEGLTEDFDFGEGETESRPMHTRTQKGLNKKLLGLIFVVVLAVIVVMGYKVYRPNRVVKTVEKTAPIKPTPAPSEIQKAETDIEKAFSTAYVAPAPVPTPTVAPVAAPAPIATSAPTKQEIPDEAEIAKLHEGLNKLNTQIDSILSQIKYLDAYSREVSDNLNRLNESISTMDNRLLALTNTTSTLSKDVGNVKNEVGHVREVLKEDGLDIDTDIASQGKKRSAKKDDQIVIAEPEYTVHAVIPGRAWLKSSKGQIVTVAEGDSIGNYGKILVIDAANGVVLTSSGVAFR